MKKLLWILLPLLLLTVMPISAAATPLVYDNGDLLTEEEESNLNEQAARVGDAYGISIVILTEYGIDGDPYRYAADWYDYGGFLSDGVILLLNMGERGWYFVTSGAMNDQLGYDYVLDSIEAEAIPWFSDGKYETGFSQFISLMDDLLYSSSDGYDDSYWDYEDDDYDSSGFYNSSYDISYFFSEVNPLPYLIALGISLLVAFLVCNGFKAQLNSAVKKTGASDYFDRDSIRMTVSSDRFLYSRTTRIRKSDDSSRSGHSGGSRSGGGSMRSFSGSSGSSHRGGGGRF